MATSKDAYIHKIKPERKDIVPVTIPKSQFGANGKKLKTAVGLKTFAYSNDTGYFVKATKKNKLVNPFNNEFPVETIPGEYYVMAKCNAECYNLYVSFLQNNRDGEYRQAQKILTDSDTKGRGYYVHTPE